MNLGFVKLGGSVITNKTKPFSVRHETLKRLLQEIYEAKQRKPNLQLILGHGSGSFGHTVAEKYISPPDPLQQRDLEASKEAIQKIHIAAEQLHRIVLGECANAKLSVHSISLQTLLQNNFTVPKNTKVPIVYGDIDDSGIIYSTETIFNEILKAPLSQKVSQIIMVTDIDGIYHSRESGNPSQIFRKISKENFAEVQKYINQPKNSDVTGSMLHKVETALKWAEQGIETVILNGNIAGNVKKALLDQEVQGTKIG